MSDAAETFLRSFHARDPGGSTRVFARGKDELGISSYQRLAQTIACRAGMRRLQFRRDDAAESRAPVPQS